MQQQRFVLAAALALALLAACVPAAPAPDTEPAAEEATAEAPAEETAAPTPEGRPLVLGDISDDPGEVIEGAQPLADYLAGQLADYGISEGQVRVAASAEEMYQLLESGEVDLYFDSVYPAMLISDDTGAKPILRRWRNGVDEYYSIIFASKESGIESIEDLPGHLIAMDNPYSTSGYALASVYLLEADLTLIGVESYDVEPAEDEVGIVFSYDDENTLQWVLSGLVDAGVTDDYHFSTFPEEAKPNLVVLAETERVPRQVVLAQPNMDDELLEAVTQALLGADESEEGRAALEAFDETAKFDEFPEGIEEALSRMREIRELVQSIPLP